MPEWQACFREAAPGLDVRCWDDPGVAADQVRYALVWEPEPGRLARLPNLRLILSSGAGVDHITADPDWPRHVGIVRMGGAETVQRMGEYVCLGALSLLRGMKRIVDAQAARRWDNFETPHAATTTRAGVMGLGNLGARAAAMLRDLGFVTAGWARGRKSIPGVDCFAGDAEFGPEPLPSAHPVWTHPKVIVTPHVASLPSRRERARYVAEAIAAFERGERPPNLYDPARGY